MTIEDALNKIEINKDITQIPSQDNIQTQDKTNTCSDIIEKYIYSLNEHYLNTRKNSPFNPSKVALFADKIKFKEDCVPILESLSKAEFLEIIKQENSEIYELVTQTDLGEYLPQSFNPTIDHLEIKGIFNLNQLLYGQELKEFEECSKIFVIPDFAFLSLFMKEEKMFRKYLDVEGDIRMSSSKNLLVIENGDKNRGHGGQLEYLSCLSNFMTKESLLRFYKKTGETSIKKMFEELSSLTKMIQDINKFGIIYENDVANLRKDLFVRLKSFHPELTC